MIVLCVNLARRLGLRPAVSALEIFFAWMEVDVEVPTYPSIRMWMQRIGLDRMQNVEKASGGLWLVDHSNQIGQEKVLVVLRVPDAQLPSVELPLRHEHLEVLTVLPGEKWKRPDVAKVYQETAVRCGVPRAVASDGAVELREPAEQLKVSRKKPLVMRDPKHFLANKFEHLLTRDPQYQEFTKRVGSTRCALQQTELAHFTPPGFKTEARFMNLGPTLTWASAVLWHLDHPESRSRQGVMESRILEKLGWLRDFAPSIQQWQACQQVISTTLKFINAQGIFRGAANELQALLVPFVNHSLSRQLVEVTIEFFRTYERRLRPDERLPLSTEILESSFARYKQLEKQHSKSGFTSLILTYPVLLRETTPQEVVSSFASVKVADVKRWTKDHLPSTVASKRQQFFREARSKRKTKNGATPISILA
jgi:hypothetical protein